MSFLPEWPVFLQFAGAAIVLTLIPGPDMALILGRSITQGKMAGLACSLGAETGVMLQVIAVAAGLSTMILVSPTAFLLLKIVGAFYLLYLAFQAIRSQSSFSINTKKQSKQSFKRNYLTGLGIDLLNPKVLLFNMTFLPQFVQASDPYAPQKLLFLGLAFIPISFPFTLAMVFAANRFARLFKENKLYTKILDWFMACIFIAFAIRLLATQAK